MLPEEADGTVSTEVSSARAEEMVVAKGKVSAVACWPGYSCSVTCSGSDLVGKRNVCTRTMAAVVVEVMMVAMWSQKVSMQYFGKRISYSLELTSA